MTAVLTGTQARFALVALEAADWSVAADNILILARIDHEEARPYYHPRAVLALDTCTDALPTPRTRAHLIGLLSELTTRGVRNPVCLITKCTVSDDMIAAIRSAQTAGVPVIFYLNFPVSGPRSNRASITAPFAPTSPASTSAASRSSTTGAR
ncbi:MULTISPECIES: hypothetical protein [Streptomyces]|uniref:Uncharacterized protein n=1 Tax=Streptomyces plicatus TaxID=1922 RepID=A0ABW1Y552_STRPL|nr:MULTISPECIES: hypothetical protein [Streptomyces]GGZ73004.1 hypothetical protein GCM10010301_53090 [Streptomyces plicatus]GHC28035.1 hypothetical protein GCM10010308_51450 [Streptomyces vinaceusdrappus]